MGSRMSIRKRLFIRIAATVCISLVGLPALQTQEHAHTVFADTAGAGSFTSGQRVTIQHKTAFFPSVLSKNSNLKNLKVSYYGAKGESLRFSSVKGEMAFFQTDLTVITTPTKCVSADNRVEHGILMVNMVVCKIKLYISCSCIC
ncbi:hypothetical protein [Paenibacillus solani]|uniref:Uncharacterized protein n=1 Tax=Paenibacillus solani TaxID=1705565 RepID=A0A0M1P0U2_9BACL|nr:hypothetical protein [Paenibacillus solani]KOR87997.1 hypothetical protein AM231_01815 [Paenibacillus solani]